MILGKRQILDAIKNGEITISPFDEKMLDKASVGIRLGSRLRNPIPGQLIDFKISDEPIYEEKQISEEGFILEPQSFVVGETMEEVEISDQIAAWVDGRMKLARVGVSIHQSSSFCDPAWENKFTLEIKNCGNFRVRLYPGLRIGALIFEEVGEAD